MYGMINRFFEVMITEEYGKETWRKIAAKAGVEDEYFIGMQQYPDDMSYAIVGAASDILGRSVDDLLRDFGKHWVAYTAEGEYAAYYDAGHDTLSFLDHVNAMHASLGEVLPDLRFPTFLLERGPDDSARLHYSSEREGLTSFVEGLVEGLADHYGEKVDIRLIECDDGDRHHDIFQLKIEARDAA